MAAPASWKWTAEDEADIEQTEQALDRLLYARARSRSHAETLLAQISACVRGLERMRALKKRLT